MRKIRDISNERFGMLTAISFNSRVKSKTLWNCICDCGNTSVHDSQNLVGGRVKSCGCQKSKIKHGHSRANRISCEYSIWRMMKDRCMNPSNDRYKDYGGRGISVCDRWLEPSGSGFINFISDMGLRPSKDHTIERVDNDGDYSPDNCMWIHQSKQKSNMRTNRKVMDATTNRVFPTIAAAARENRIHKGYLRDMLLGKRTNKTNLQLL